MNKSAKAVIGYQEDEVLGKFSPTLFLSEGIDLQVLLNKAKFTGLEMLEVEAIKRDGTKFPSRIVITPVLDGTSLLQGFLISSAVLHNLFRS